MCFAGKANFTVHMLCKEKCCALQENEVRKQLTLDMARKQTDPYVVDY